MLDKLTKTEFWVAIAGGIATVGTALIETGVLAPLPKVAALVGIATIVATYIAGRSWVKAAEARAGGGNRADAPARSLVSDPPHPQVFRPRRPRITLGHDEDRPPVPGGESREITR